MLDLTIAKLLLDKGNYSKYNNIIYSLDIEKDIYKILLVISKYYEEYKHHSYISLDELESYYYIHYPSDKNSELAQKLFIKLRSLETSDSLAASIVTQYVEKEYGKKCVELLMPLLQGQGRDSLLQLPALIEEFKQKVHIVDEEQSPFNEKGLDELLSAVGLEDGVGLSWRLKCIERNIGRMTGGTLGHFFGRPEIGKTTFLASEVTHFASQMLEDDGVLWICNEEHEDRVKLRIWESALAMTGAELAASVRDGRSNELHERFCATGGNRIRVHYDTNVSAENITSLLEKFPSKVLVVDIADHVTFRGDGEYTGPARLGELYRRYRRMAANHNCDVITVGQASADCAGRRELHQEDMHNSRTDKPGALDYALGIGRTYNKSEEDSRWITVVRNKIGVTVEEVNPVLIDRHRGRFTDLGGE